MELKVPLPKWLFNIYRTFKLANSSLFSFNVELNGFIYTNVFIYFFVKKCHFDIYL